MGSNNYTTTGNYTWTVPPDVFTILVQVGGGGGGGGGGNATLGGAGGAGGGSSQLNAYTVVPGANHNVTCGNGGAGGGASANGSNGTASVFRHSNNANAAVGGGGARGIRYNTANSAGGNGTLGNINYRGGNGAGRNGTTGIWSGSGGGGAGTAANGSAGSNASANAAGGAGGANNGGNGGSAVLNSTGQNGIQPGGGGAGGGAANRTGGRGGVGVVHIEWADPTPPTCTTNNTTDITSNSANGQGNITGLGAQPQNVTTRGFVYDTQTRGAPGNNTPQNSTYNNYVSENGSWGTGTFSMALNNLTSSTTYFIRAFVYHNVGYNYENELSFNTAGVQTANASDSFNVADNTTVDVYRGGTAPQSLNIADTIAAVGEFSVGASQSLNIADAVVAVSEFPVGASQSLNVADNTTADLLKGGIAAQSLNIADTSTARHIPSNYIVLINPSNYIADNAANNTTTQLTAPTGKNNATFTAGKISDDINPLPSITLNNTYTELEWSLILGNNVANNAIIEFRVTGNGTAFNNYAQIPTITIGEVGNNNVFGNCTDGIGFGSTTDKVAILNAALAEAINMSGPGNSLAGYLVALSSATNLSSNATKIATFSSLLTSALSIQSLTSSIGTLNAIASSVINITSSTSITATFAGQASQTINIGSTTASLANMLASASSSFTLQDTVAAAFLYAALASQSLTLSSVSDAEVTAEILAFCEEVLGLSATDLAGMQAIAQLVSAFTTTAGATAISTLVRTLQSTVNLSSTTAREKTTAAALSQLLNVLSSATRRADAQAQATTPIAISSSITNLANLFNQMISSLALTATSDWEGELLGIMTEHLGVASVAAIERFITALSLATVAFTENMSSKLEFQILLEEHVALTDIIGVLRTVAASCADVFNIGDISLWLSATGEVSVTFQLSKGTITFVLTKPSISGVLTQPTITFEGD